MYLGVEDCENNFIGIIVSGILLGISLVIIAYLIYTIYRLKTSKENPENKIKETNDSKDIYENPAKDDENYEQVENQQSTYTGLKRNKKDDKGHHVYCDLNKVTQDHVNQEETGI